MNNKLFVNSAEQLTELLPPDFSQHRQDRLIALYLVRSNSDQIKDTTQTAIDFIALIIKNIFQQDTEEKKSRFVEPSSLEKIEKCLEILWIIVKHYQIINHEIFGKDNKNVHYRISSKPSSQQLTINQFKFDPLCYFKLLRELPLNSLQDIQQFVALLTNNGENKLVAAKVTEQLRTEPASVFIPRQEIVSKLSATHFFEQMAMQKSEIVKAFADSIHHPFTAKTLWAIGPSRGDGVVTFYWQKLRNAGEKEGPIEENRYFKHNNKFVSAKGALDYSDLCHEGSTLVTADHGVFVFHTVVLNKDAKSGSIYTTKSLEIELTPAPLPFQCAVIILYVRDEICEAYAEIMRRQLGAEGVNFISMQVKAEDEAGEDNLGQLKQEQLNELVKFIVFSDNLGLSIRLELIGHGNFKSRALSSNYKTANGWLLERYTKESEHYDTFHEGSVNSRTTNSAIEKILKKQKVKTVLALTCGTGSQVFWLAKRGFTVTGSDINQSMLQIAKNKAMSGKINIKLLQGDMRTIKVGKFDAALTIFNAIGHLTKAGFEKTMQNIHRNLNDGGIYVFDIINLSYVNDRDNIIKMSYELIETLGNTRIRDIQHSIIDNDRILISYTTTYVQEGSEKLRMSKSIGTLQLYTAKELKQMLARNGFKVLGQYGIDGSKFSEKKTERI